MFDETCNTFREHIDTISLGCIPVVQVSIIVITFLTNTQLLTLIIGEKFIVA